MSESHLAWGISPQGNYDQYVKTRLELEENQMKRFHWEQDQIAHMKVGKLHCSSPPGLGREGG